MAKEGIVHAWLSRRTCMVCRIFVGYLSQKSPIISGSFAERARHGKKKTRMSLNQNILDSPTEIEIEFARQNSTVFNITNY